MAIEKELLDQLLAGRDPKELFAENCRSNLEQHQRTAHYVQTKRMLKLLYQRGIWFRLNEKRSSLGET